MCILAYSTDVTLRCLNLPSGSLSLHGQFNLGDLISRTCHESFSSLSGVTSAAKGKDFYSQPAPTIRVLRKRHRVPQSQTHAEERPTTSIRTLHTTCNTSTHGAYLLTCYSVAQSYHSCEDLPPECNWDPSRPDQQRGAQNFKSGPALSQPRGQYTKSQLRWAILLFFTDWSTLDHLGSKNCPKIKVSAP